MVRTLYVLLFATLIFNSAQAGPDNMIIKTSPHSVAVTAANFVAAVKGAGATVFAVVDHAKGAKSVDMDLAPATVVIFGNPKLGTPPMQVNPLVGLDLPLKVLIWDKDGTTMIGYLDPQALKARYDIQGADKTFQTMAGALKKLTDKAAGP
ncbi:hypothetical protein MNBD_ALPHA09-1266 [hydrothermal vent metagenome]|uniref:DUF302 domain-containing protein n=1 Tax=hydrothermal vent metagenome TaxID=652676 RepID=A0A3B0TJG8_9ZZZZ